VDENGWSDLILRSALIQMACQYEKDENVERAVHLVDEAAAGGARLICLQELFNTTYFPVEVDSRHFALAEPIPGPSTEPLRQLARERNVVIVASLYEKVFAGEYYNSSVIIGTDGEIAGLYRKSSIPITETKTLRGYEKYYFRPGDTGFKTFDVGLGVRLGILICYDRHFPEAARALALQGAELILIPATTCGMSRSAWEVELRAHAMQNMCFVGGVNRVGDEAGYDWYGSSVWIDPRGEVLARAGDSEDEVLFAELDLSAVEEVRGEWGFFRDRRPDLYSLLTTSQVPS
jgi:N-carbamoylputrescine amidase